MRAAVMRNRQLVVDDLPEPEPGVGEVLVKPLACGICGSDLHVLKHADRFAAATETVPGGGLDPARDLVMGHEFSAEVLDYGPRTERTHAPGTVVTAMPVLFRERQAVTVGYSHAVPGGYAERTLLMSSLLLPVPNGLSAEHAALTEPMAVGWHAVEKAAITPDDVPLVIGCGPVGLSVIAALKRRRVGPVIAADFSPARRRLAEVLGADEVIDPAATSPYESWVDAARASAQGARTVVNPLTGEPRLPPGVFFECVGVPGVIDQMIVGAQPGCRFVVVGVCMETDHFRPLLAIGKELNIQFVLGYTPEEYAGALHAIAQGELPVEPLISDRVGVSGVARAFRELADPERHAKILVEPWRT